MREGKVFPGSFSLRPKRGIGPMKSQTRAPSPIVEEPSIWSLGRYSVRLQQVNRRTVPDKASEDRARPYTAQ
jgi:hypothetical protein